MKDDMLSIGFLLAALATIFNTAECDCYTKSLKADTTTKSYAVDIPGNDCFSVYIRPSSSYRSAYFLEISWSGSKFDVKGDMPLCKNEYVEVRLTRKHRSVGKFCSNNAGQPFPMYSSDGYAQIHYSTQGHEKGRGFKFYYRMRSSQTNYLGTSVTRTDCYNTKNYGDSGVISSTGWPSFYTSSYSPCVYTIQRLHGYQGVHIVIMDLNLRCCYSNHVKYYSCIQLFGSNSPSFSNKKVISSKHCGFYASSLRKLVSYTSYHKYLQIVFQRELSEEYYQGFLTGYIMFRAPRGASTPTSSSNRSSQQYEARRALHSRKLDVVSAVLIALLIAIVIINISVVAIIYYRKRHMFVANDDQAQGIDIGSTSQEDAAQQIVQIARSLPQESSVSQSLD